MKLSIKGAAFACGLVWGGAVLCVGITNAVQGRYGREFLQMLSSVYPGYKARRGAKHVLVGTGYALADGAIAGATYAWLYNRFSGRQEKAKRLAA